MRWYGGALGVAFGRGLLAGVDLVADLAGYVWVLSNLLAHPHTHTHMFEVELPQTPAWSVIRHNDQLACGDAAQQVTVMWQGIKSCGITILANESVPFVTAVVTKAPMTDEGPLRTTVAQTRAHQLLAGIAVLNHLRYVTASMRVC